MQDSFRGTGLDDPEGAGEEWVGLPSLRGVFRGAQ